MDSPYQDYLISEPSSLVDKMITVFERMSFAAGVSSKKVFAELIEKLIAQLHERTAEAITVYFYRWKQDKRVDLTVHNHDQIGRALDHVVKIVDGDPMIAASEDTVSVSVFVVGTSDEKHKVLSPLEASGFLTNLLEGIGDEWNAAQIRDVFNEATTHLRNARDAGHLFVVLGARLHVKGLEQEEPYFTSSEQDADKRCEELRRKGYRAMSLCTYQVNQRA